MVPKNLEEKLSLLLDDLETLNKHESIKKIKSFIENEVDFLNAEHLIEKYDLYLVKDSASKEFSNKDPRTIEEGFFSNGDDFRAWCWINATVELLRGKGLIPFTIKYKK